MNLNFEVYCKYDIEIAQSIFRMLNKYEPDIIDKLNKLIEVEKLEKREIGSILYLIYKIKCGLCRREGEMLISLSIYEENVLNNNEVLLKIVHLFNVHPDFYYKIEEKIFEKFRKSVVQIFT